MKKFATVWRVENARGWGLYSDGAFRQILERNGMDLRAPEHPEPGNDANLKWPGHDAGQAYHFGFASLAQFKQWVYKPAWRRELSEAGLVLSKYYVPVKFFRRSQYQAIFAKEMARLIDHRRLDYSDKLKGV